jgi:hypothetical protein
MISEEDRSTVRGMQAMWLITNFGFFSIVQKQGDSDLTIRSRVRGDLEALRAKYLPGLGEIRRSNVTDYRYRAMVAPADLAEAMGKIIRDITYDNFKNRVAEKQGPRRAHVYHRVWEDLLELSEEDFETVIV